MSLHNGSQMGRKWVAKFPFAELPGHITLPFKKTARIHRSAPGPVMERKRTAMGYPASWQNDLVFPAGSLMTWWIVAPMASIERVALYDKIGHAKINSTRIGI